MYDNPHLEQVMQDLQAEAGRKSNATFGWVTLPPADEPEATAFDFVTMAEDLPPEPEKPVEKPRRHLFDDLPFGELQAKVRRFMTPKWMEY